MMNLSHRFFWLLTAVAGALMGNASAAPEAAPVSVVVSSQIVGHTPTHIGYVLGEDLPGSNVSSWLRYSEMNSARFWWPFSVWPAPPAPWTSDNSLAHFESERARFRPNIEQEIDWSTYKKGVSKAFGGTPPGTLGDSFVLSELHKMNAAPLLMLSHSRPQMPFDSADGKPDWFGRWTFWRGVYTNVFYLARTYGVERFQLFNEPDHPDSGPFPQPDYLKRLQLGSDAVQAAIADVNRLDGKSLKAQVSAPVTAGMTVYGPRSGRKDTRDAQTGWGELVVRANNADFPGRSADNRGLFQAYAFQNYTKNPTTISGRLPGLIERITQDNGGERLPIIASEMNVSTALDFAKTEATLDTPAYYAAFGAIAAAYANAGLDEAYIFRLTQTNNLNGAVKKNGTHFSDNADPLKNILGSTKGAEAVRLFMRGFKGGRSRFAIPQSSQPDLHLLAARDEKSGAYTLMLSNLGLSRTVALDLSAWKLPQGTLATIEEVSETHHGDISGIASLPSNGSLSLAMSANSIDLVTLRSNLSATPRLLPVTSAAGLWRVEGRVALSRQFVLAFEASTAKPGQKLRVYGGASDLAQAELLGQVVPTAKSAAFLVDVTRYAQAAGDSPLVFQIVNEQGRTDSFHIGAAQLHVFAVKH